MELAAEEVLRHLQFEIQVASASQPWTPGWVEQGERQRVINYWGDVRGS